VRDDHIAGHKRPPLPASVAANVTVTGVLFQPAALGPGVMVAVISGGSVFVIQYAEMKC
jgi:hypothetical protein